MGFQQYIIFFNTDEEYENILKVIEKHNTDDDYENIGEDLDLDCIVDVIKPYKVGLAKDCIKGLICHNGGGRHITRRYLFMNGLRVEFMSEAISKRTKICE